LLTASNPVPSYSVPAAAWSHRINVFQRVQ